MQDRKKIAAELYHAGDSLLSVLETQVEKMQADLKYQTDAAAQAAQKNANLENSLKEKTYAVEQAKNNNETLQKRLARVCNDLRKAADQIEGRP